MKFVQAIPVYQRGDREVDRFFAQYLADVDAVTRALVVVPVYGDPNKVVRTVLENPAYDTTPDNLPVLILEDPSGGRAKLPLPASADALRDLFRRIAAAVPHTGSASELATRVGTPRGAKPNGTLGPGGGNHAGNHGHGGDDPEHGDDHAPPNQQGRLGAFFTLLTRAMSFGVKHLPATARERFLGTVIYLALIGFVVSVIMVRPTKLVIAGAFALVVLAVIVGVVNHTIEGLSAAARTALSFMIVLGLLGGLFAVGWATLRPPPSPRAPEEIQVRGTVVYADGAPVQGAAVSVVGDSRSTLTLATGAFDLTVRPSVVRRDTILIRVDAGSIGLSFTRAYPDNYVLTVPRAARPPADSTRKQLARPTPAPPGRVTSEPVLEIDSVALSGPVAGGSIRIVAVVNGTTFNYPSLTDDGVWVRVRPDLAGQTYPLPPARAGGYEVRFTARVRTDDGEIHALSSSEVPTIKKLPSAMLTYQVYLTKNGIREAPAGYIRYRILPRPPSQ